MSYKLITKYKPSKDQAKSIKALVKGLNEGKEHQILKGATGTGKTFTIANVIKETNRPVLIFSHNKTLAAQLYSEMKGLFSENRVEYFISNFDFYRPEAYIPTSDTYVEKTSKSNWDIETMRMAATNAFLKNSPSIVVSSVASIYGHTAPVEYEKQYWEIQKSVPMSRNEILTKLVKARYERNSIDFDRGKFRVQGDVIDINPIHPSSDFIRVELFGDDIEEIKLVDKETLEYKTLDSYTVLPATEYVVGDERVEKAIVTIKEELKERFEFYKLNKKTLEFERLKMRINSDIESLKEYGYCPGMENYARHFDGRKPNVKPFTLLDYLIENSKKTGIKPLIIIDESHIMMPQLRAMHSGDRSRKLNLVDFGFRLPSALDNRPLMFEEFEALDIQKIYVSATPGEYELEKTSGEVVSQIIRPTGLLDPKITILPVANQSEQIYDKILEENKKDGRTLILTTTKRVAEEFSKYFIERGIKATYIHSDLKTFQRIEVLRKFRKGIYDVLIGINLMREGIDIPEITQIFILDAGKESFFRSATSLIQIIGRAARNDRGHVYLMSDSISRSMRLAIDETNARRDIQIAHNKKYGITPKTIVKDIDDPINGQDIGGAIELYNKKNTLKTKKQLLASMRAQMFKAAREQRFEHAANLRDYIIELEMEDEKK